MTVIAKTYAKALYDSAENQNELDALMAFIDHFQKACIGSSDFRAFISNKDNLGCEQRREVIVALENGMTSLNRVQTLVFRCLHILNNNNRLSSLFAVFDCFRERYRVLKNILHTEIFSVEPLEVSIVERISVTLEQKFNKKIVTSCTTDPSMLGGLKIKAGSYLFDDSYKTRLEQLRRKVKEAEHGA